MLRTDNNIPTKMNPIQHHQDTNHNPAKTLRLFGNSNSYRLQQQQQPGKKKEKKRNIKNTSQSFASP